MGYGYCAARGYNDECGVWEVSGEVKTSSLEGDFVSIAISYCEGFGLMFVIENGTVLEKFDVFGTLLHR